MFKTRHDDDDDDDDDDDELTLRDSVFFIDSIGNIYVLSSLCR